MTKRTLRRLYRLRKQVERLQLDLVREAKADAVLRLALARLSEGVRVATIRLGGIYYVG